MNIVKIKDEVLSRALSATVNYVYKKIDPVLDQEEFQNIPYTNGEYLLVADAGGEKYILAGFGGENDNSYGLGEDVTPYSFGDYIHANSITDPYMIRIGPAYQYLDDLDDIDFTGMFVMRTQDNHYIRRFSGSDNKLGYALYDEEMEDLKVCTDLAGNIRMSNGVSVNTTCVWFLDNPTGAWYITSPSCYMNGSLKLSERYMMWDNQRLRFNTYSSPRSIKIDIYKRTTTEDPIPPAPDPIDFFNNNLKGKYAVAFNYKYVFPLGVEGISDTLANIVRIEKMQPTENVVDAIWLPMPDGNDKSFFRDLDYIRTEDYEDLIEYIGDLDKYIYLNEFTTDDDITLDELKRFRTWLAEILYANPTWIDDWSKDPDKHRNMLQYYIQEMYDPAVKSLMKFNSYVDINSISKQSGCGCANNAVTYTADVLSVCDPLLIYRHNMYKYMVEIFSDITYWLGQVKICGEMKKYIDNIIKVGLPLASVSLYNNFADCTCVNIDIDEQTAMTNILKRLSQALGYIIEDNVSGNRNFISSAFLDWSTYLYEKMRW